VDRAQAIIAQFLCMELWQIRSCITLPLIELYVKRERERDDSVRLLAERNLQHELSLTRKGFKPAVTVCDAMVEDLPDQGKPYQQQ